MGRTSRATLILAIALAAGASVGAAQAAGSPNPPPQPSWVGADHKVDANRAALVEVAVVGRDGKLIPNKKARLRVKEVPPAPRGR